MADFNLIPVPKNLHERLWEMAAISVLTEGPRDNLDYAVSASGLQRITS